MKTTRAQKIRLGAFMITGSTIILGAVVVLAGLQVFEQRDVYTVHFTDNVSGLETSAPVRYQGLRVGRVESMGIAPDDAAKIEVILSLEPGTALHEGTQAYLDMSGLTGLKSVNLKGGDPRASVIQPGSQIPAGESLMDQLTGRAEKIALEAEKVVTQIAQWTREENLERAERLLDNAADLTGNINLYLEDNRATFNRTLTKVGDASQAIAGLSSEGDRSLKVIRSEISLTLQEARRTLAAYRKPVEGLDPKEVSATITAAKNALTKLDSRLSKEEIGGAVTDLQQTLSNMNRLVSELDLAVRAGREDFTATLSYLRQAAEDMREFSRIIAQDPSTLLRGRE